MKTLEEIIAQKNPEARGKINEIVSDDKERFEDVLIRSNLLDPEELLEVLSEFYGVPLIGALSEDEIDRELIQTLPISYAKK